MPRKHSLKTKLAFWSMPYENVCESLSNKVCVVLCLWLWIPETTTFLNLTSSRGGEELPLPTRWTNPDILFVFLSGNSHSKGKGSPNFLQLLSGSFFFLNILKETAWVAMENGWVSFKYWMLWTINSDPMITAGWPCLAAPLTISQSPPYYCLGFATRPKGFSWMMFSP